MPLYARTAPNQGPPASHYLETLKMSEPNLEHATGCSMHEPYPLQVLGDSMEPEFPDRCVILIEPTEFCHSGMYVFAEVEGVRWFRQYLRDPDGHEWLVASNEIYPDIDLRGLDWKVLGVIIQRNVRRKIKHYKYGAGEPAAPQVPLSDLTGRH
jgi:SOS-response transcriptional repressor LexA